MSKFDFLSSYQDWRVCIEKSCGIPLTRDFINKRMGVLSETQTEESVRFIQRYGEDHYRKVLSWFQKARSELPNE